MAKILLVEDDKLLLEGMERWLARERYIVESVNNAQEGLEFALHNPCDVIVLDWELPTGSGLEILSVCRSKGLQTPILMLTGRKTIADKRLGLDMGADDYLTKPFDLVELSARIRALLRRSKNQYQELLESNNVVLDPSKRTVEIGGAKVRLTPKEFELLELLMRQPGKPFSAEAICNHLWPLDADISPESIRTYMNRLRSKVNFDEEKPLIKTVWGQGYKFGD